MAQIGKREGSKTGGGGRSGKIRILLVDDHPIVLKGIQDYLQVKDHIKVIGRAVDGVDAVQKAKKLQPDVVVLDLGLPKMAGIEVLKTICSNCPGTKLIAYTMHESAEFVRQAVQAGTDAYVLKSSSLTLLARAIEKVAGGRTFFDPNISRELAPILVDVSASPRRNGLVNCTYREAIRRPESQGLGTVSWRQTERQKAIVDRASKYISSNLSPSLSVKIVAAAMNINPSDLEHAYRRVIGMTVKKHIDSLCREQVEIQLKCGNAKGYSLARDLGFNTDQAFYRWIKRVFEIPFSELINQRFPGTHNPRKRGLELPSRNQ